MATIGWPHTTTNHRLQFEVEVEEKEEEVEAAMLGGRTATGGRQNCDSQLASHLARLARHAGLCTKREAALHMRRGTRVAATGAAS